MSKKELEAVPELRSGAERRRRLRYIEARREAIRQLYGCDATPGAPRDGEIFIDNSIAFGLGWCPVTMQRRDGRWLPVRRLHAGHVEIMVDEDGAWAERVGWTSKQFLAQRLELEICLDTNVRKCRAQCEAIGYVVDRIIPIGFTDGHMGENA